MVFANGDFNADLATNLLMAYHRYSVHVFATLISRMSQDRFLHKICPSQFFFWSQVREWERTSTEITGLLSKPRLLLPSANYTRQVI